MQFNQTNENGGNVNNTFGKAPAEMFALTKADWEPYFGCGIGRKIPTPDTHRFGGVSFRRHLGKPLSQDLWEDLVHRFCITSLCIVRYGDEIKTIGHGPGYCEIQLDESDNVMDIRICPHFPR